MSKHKSKKIRLESGRVYPECTLSHELSAKEVINQCLEPQYFYDAWFDYRDGMKCIRDKSKIYSLSTPWSTFDIPTFNEKNKRMLRIREAMKHGRSCTI